MNRIVILSIAIVCGLLGTFGIISATMESTAGDEQMVQIVAARVDMASGEIIDQTKITMKTVPVQFAVPGAITWQDRQRIVGQQLIGPVIAGTPLSSMSIFGGGNEMFESQIPRGYRALSIGVSTQTGVSGLLRPGSRVDLIGIFSQTIEAGNIVPTTQIKVLLQNVQILAAGRQTSTTTAMDLTGGRGGAAYSTITVAVTLDEAEMLIAASQRGTLYCVLRNPMEDTRPVETTVQTLNQALSDEAVQRINQKRHGLQIDN